MASFPRPDVQDPYTMMRSLKWSSAEKVIARKAFEHALQQDLGAVIRQAKKMAARIEQPSDLWELERFVDVGERRIFLKRMFLSSPQPCVAAGRASIDEL